MSFFDFTLEELQAEVAQDRKDRGEIDPLPDGTYKFIIDQSTAKTPKTGGAEYLALTLSVIEGEHENRKFWANLNLKHEKQVVRNIAKARFVELCNSTGITDLAKAIPEDFTDKVIMGRLHTGKNGRQNLVAIGPVTKDETMVADSTDDIPF